MSSAKRAFISNLKKYMDLRGMTPAELSRKTKIKPPNISGYLNGSTSPGLEILEKLAAAVGVTPSDLVRQIGPADPANKMLNSPELKSVTISATHVHRAKTDFEWQGVQYKKGDIYEGDDIPVLLYLKQIEVFESKYSREFNANSKASLQRIWASWRNAPPKAQQLCELILTPPPANKKLLEEIDLSPLSLKTVSELLQMLYGPPKSRPKV